MHTHLYRLLRTHCIFGWLLLTFSGITQASEQKILVMGDSISAAYGMSLEQGWVAQLSAAVQKEFPQYRIINASISGETTNGGVQRLPELLLQHQPSLVILELGANDGLRGYPLKTLRDNLQTMVVAAQQGGAAVLLLPMEIPPNYGSRYTTGFRQSYQDVASDTGVASTGFILDGFATDPKLMQADGIHPTVEAQPLLLANILPAVLEVLRAL